MDKLKFCTLKMKLLLYTYIHYIDYRYIRRQRTVDVYRYLLLPRIFLGSLKDVLENEAIQLDWNFRMSLIHDIVKVY